MSKELELIKKIREFGTLESSEQLEVLSQYADQCEQNAVLFLKVALGIPEDDTNQAAEAIVSHIVTAAVAKARVEHVRAIMPK